jgi:hypothetical protein
MQTSDSPYLPIPLDLVSSGKLLQIKQSADHFACSASTLKANAKAGRLRAFQQYGGAPVLVLASDVEEFLKSRPDIASVCRPATSAPAPQPWPVPPGHNAFPPLGADVLTNPAVALAPPPSVIPPVPPLPYTPSVPPVPLAPPPPLPPTGTVPLGGLRLGMLDTATHSELATIAAFVSELSITIAGMLASARGHSGETAIGMNHKTIP